MQDMEFYVEGFQNLAKERLPDGVWARLYDCVVGMLSVHLLSRLAFRLYARIVELERRVEKLELAARLKP